MIHFKCFLSIFLANFSRPFLLQLIYRSWITHYRNFLTKSFSEVSEKIGIADQNLELFLKHLSFLFIVAGLCMYRCKLININDSNLVFSWFLISLIESISLFLHLFLLEIGNFFLLEGAPDSHLASLVRLKGDINGEIFENGTV